MVRKSLENVPQMLKFGSFYCANEVELNTQFLVLHLLYIFYCAITQL